MSWFILGRIVQGMVVMLVVALVSFSIFQYVGDPVTSILGQDASESDRTQLRAELGLDKPAPVQFARFLARATTGDFGLSLSQGQRVSSLLAERFPATFELASLAGLASLVFGIPLGVYAALHRRSVGARLGMAVSLLGVSVPTFFLGILLILVFSVHLHWLPSFGRGDTVNVGGWNTGLLTLDGWRHALLPASTLAAFQLALVVRLVRSEMLEVLRADYIRFARARGLRDRSIHFRHALRNTLMPVLTIVGLQFGGLIAFAIITESVFQWPGLGLLFIQAIGTADVPVMAAYLCMVAAVFIVINLLVDVAYALVDPRLRRR